MALLAWLGLDSQKQGGKRKGRGAVHPVASSSKPPANKAPVTALPRKLPELEDFSKAPKIISLLTSDTGEIPLPKEVATSAIAYLTTDKVCVLVGTSKLIQGAYYRTLRSRIKENFKAYSLKEFQASTNIICQLYKAANAEADVTGITVSEVDAKEYEGILQSMLEFALQRKATDIHIVVRQQSAAVLMRINGRLVVHNRFFPLQMIQFCGYLFNKKAEDGSRNGPAFNVRLKQRCMVPVTANGQDLKLRYNSCPMLGGFDAVLRVLKLDVDQEGVTLPQLGYENSQQRELTIASKTPVGLTVISGITGSGKSTTLQTLMMLPKDRKFRKYYSMEDPVEYRMFGVSQAIIPESSDGENPFLDFGKTFLRMDPDVIMIGEIRDDQAAEMVQTMVETGHQVMTTIHASSAPGIINRLCSKNIGLPREVVADQNFLTELVYQALLPTLCPHCRLQAIKHLPVDRLKMIESKLYLSSLDSLYIVNDAGCDHCYQTGYAGLTVAAEILTPTADIRRAILNKDTVGIERLWRETRKTGFEDPDMQGKTAFEHGIYKVTQGLVDLRDVELAFKPLERYEVVNVNSYNS